MLKTLDLILVIEKKVIIRMVKQVWAYALTFHIFKIWYKGISIFIPAMETSLLELKLQSNFQTKHFLNIK